MSRIEFDVNEAAQLYLSGCSLSEIGRMYGCNYMTIGRRLRAHGIEIRGHGPVLTHKEDVDLEQIAHEYRDLGMTSYELGPKYGVNPATIRSWMRSIGIHIGKENAPMRGNSGGNGKGAAILKDRCRERVVKKLVDDGDTLELVEYG